MKRTDFSKYFDERVNDCNWEVAVNKDGFFRIVDGDGTALTDDIDHARDAFIMANAQRLLQLLDKKRREIFYALIMTEQKQLEEKHND